MTRTPIRCPDCGYTMAQTDGQTLYIAGVTVTHSCTLHCAQADCRGFKRWYPAPKPAPKREQVPV